MSMFPSSQFLRRQCGAIGLAAFLLAPPPFAEGGPILRVPPRAAISSHVESTDHSTDLGTVLGAAGVVELMSTAPATCDSNDSRLEQGREQLDEAREMREVSRARVVADHLRVTQESTAALETSQDEEDLESERAEVHNAKQDVKQDEDQLEQARCSAASGEASLAPANSDIVGVRMEFPARYLQSLERALGSGSAAITAYRYSDHAAITSRLTSVESALADGTPIVIARARLDDSLHRLRDAELVDVAVQLPVV